ncbi:MAG: NTP transferase domain-containing protein [Selenomonas sp.]|uniref:phosphocholine cytidylyltransferase family protein n=1 Tax=Selenomonas sp. TaxID=2053611 RepID=UPI0025FA8888|nr:NTP transferase domain-containing protein [Selenomonas sp.]MCI6086327.1 NTP transferase domain-containing protein [Selenomonas sp.]
MKAILLAAGQGKRLGAYTNGKPKCLLPLGEDTILSRELKQLRSVGIVDDDIYVLGGYRAELLRPIVPNLIVNPDYDKYENSYSLGYALEHVPEDDVLILDTDLCFDESLLEDVIQDEHENLVLSRKSDDLDESTGIKVDGNGRVLAIGKGYPHTGYVYMSIFKVGRGAVADFREALLSEKNIHTWYTPAITDICQKHMFYNLVTDKKWHEIDFVEDYLETKKLFGWE